MTTTPASETPDQPPFRYTGELACSIEATWQERWKQWGTFHTPNPTGDLAEGFDPALPKLYVLDMFPYPSGTGLHIGHPAGYTGTDAYTRFKRMCGFNVLYAMGFDAFGLPAEQYAVQTGQHPRVTTEQNVANMRSQLGRLGYAHDERRSPSTTDVEFYKWTQWMFLQIFNSWFDEAQNKARPIAELRAEFDSGTRPTPAGSPAFAELGAIEQQRLVDNHRLAYRAKVPVNWCPGLGTVLANEEVTPDGRSERGNFPVYRRDLEQWMMRITSYADRLIDDLDSLDWPESIKLMQRNWIGRSEGAQVNFDVVGSSEVVSVFTTRPDTLFGATYVVIAPEHPLVDRVLAPEWPNATPASWTANAPTPADAVGAYRDQAARSTEAERTNDEREKTGVFTGTYAVNPTNGDQIPVFVADYVLAHYGTGCVMAVPAHDDRDYAFAQKFSIAAPIVVQPPSDWLSDHGVDSGATDAVQSWPIAFTGHDGVAVSSRNDTVQLDGLGMIEAKKAITTWLESTGVGRGTVTYKLRDWLFSRQRYWGEPFPIVYDQNGHPHAIPESMLPVELPEVDDYAPLVVGDDDAPPQPPLSRATDWVNVTLDLGDGPQQYRRELNTMPQWAGSCWYEMRYLDPTNADAFIDPVVEEYWSNGDRTVVDMYIGGAEHAVLHLLYSRFWHKVLFDLGHMRTREPFAKLFSIGHIGAYAYTDERGFYVPAAEIEERDGGYFYEGNAVSREYGKMGKSLKNAVDPLDIINEYGADTLRTYLMSIGPLDKAKPWETRNIVGTVRFLQRVWRNVVDEDSGECIVSDQPCSDETRRILHRTIDAVRSDYDELGFNTAIARMIELNNHLTGLASVPREAAEALVLLLAPLSPHFSEELWSRLGHDGSLHRFAFPEADLALLTAQSVVVPVQVKGKKRGVIEVAPDADEKTMREMALALDTVKALLGGAEPRQVIVVPGRLVNIVV